MHNDNDDNHKDNNNDSNNNNDDDHHAKAVLARNFPAGWVAPAVLDKLPQRVQSLLQRIGPFLLLVVWLL